jgi:hypothetical protein
VPVELVLEVVKGVTFAGVPKPPGEAGVAGVTELF